MFTTLLQSGEHENDFNICRQQTALKILKNTDNVLYKLLNTLLTDKFCAMYYFKNSKESKAEPEPESEQKQSSR